MNNTEVKNQDKTFVVTPTPTVLSIRDVVVVLGVVFAIASSYFTSDNRHNTNEHSIKILTEQYNQLKDKSDKERMELLELKTEFRIMIEQNKNIQRDIDDLKTSIKDIKK